VIVPDVVGRTETQARGAIEAADLIVGAVTRECSATVETGKVIRQTPSGGSGVEVGSRVDLVISTGPCVTVPDVVGKIQAEAESTLIGAGLQVGGVKEQCSNTVPSGRVIAQNPLSGENASIGDKVDIVVSTGMCPEQTEVNLYAYSGIDHVYIVWEARVSWDVLGYRLYRREGASGSWIQIGGGATELLRDTSYRDYGVNIGREYWYRLDVVKVDMSVDSIGPVRVEGGRIVLWLPELEWVSGSGTELRVPVNIGNAMGLNPYVMDIDVAYDKTQLVAVRVEKTAVSSGMQMYYNVRKLGIVQIGAVPPQDQGQNILRGEGHLFDIIFEPVGTLTEDTCIALTFMENDLFDASLKPVPVEARGGNICIRSECVRGDMDSNGKVQMVDALMLLRKIVKRDWDKEGYPCLLKRGDINGDGILDVADVSMLMRWSVGMQINPEQTDVIGEQKSWTKMVGSDTEVKVVGGSPSGSEMSNYGVGIELSSLGGLAGVDIAISYGMGLNYKGLVLGDKVSKFYKEEEVGEGYVRVSISNNSAVVEDVRSTVLVFQFEVSGVSGDKKEERSIQIREIRLKGQYGDDFRWYGNVKREDGVITICPAVKDLRGMTWSTASTWLIGAGYNVDKVEEARLDMEPGKVIRTEPGAGVVLSAGNMVVLVMSKAGTKEQLIAELKSDFGSLDSNGDGQVSWSEASAKYPGLTQEVFNQVDTNSDGSISKSEVGIAGQEGEGSIQPKEGEGSAQPTEGEGSTETPTETKQGCGCFGGKSLGNDTWWKYILDVILFGMLIVSMSGMRRRRR